MCLMEDVILLSMLGSDLGQICSHNPTSLAVKETKGTSLERMDELFRDAEDVGEGARHTYKGDTVQIEYVTGK